MRYALLFAFAVLLAAALGCYETAKTTVHVDYESGKSLFGEGEQLAAQARRILLARPANVRDDMFEFGDLATREDRIQARTQIVGTSSHPLSLVRNIQEQAKRLGCYSGTVDGFWSQKLRAALEHFLLESNARLQLEKPEPALLALLENSSHQDAPDLRPRIWCSGPPQQVADVSETVRMYRKKLPVTERKIAESSTRHIRSASAETLFEHPLGP